MNRYLGILFDSRTLRYAGIWLTIVLVIAACSSYHTARRTTKKIARDMMVSDEDLKKSIAILKFENQSYYTNEKIEEIFQNTITGTIQSACTNIQLISPGDPRYPKKLKSPPRLKSGRIDNLKLVEIGRLHGIGAIATGSILHVSSYQEKRGLYWLREDHFFLQVQIHLEVFDTETGAKLLDENRLEEVEIEEDDYYFIKERRQVPIVEVLEKITYSASLLGEKICDSLANQVWKSYVVSKKGTKITISSGKNAGVQTGYRFIIYDTGKLIKGIGDEHFLLPGKKIGEIKITEVHQDKADAVSEMDDGIRPGDIVKSE